MIEKSVSFSLALAMIAILGQPPSQFKKDFKKITKRSISDIIEVGNVISILQRGEALAAKHVDHSLSGGWLGYRDCHVKPDLVLIYKIDSQTLKLARIGSHTELF